MMARRFDAPLPAKIPLTATIVRQRLRPDHLRRVFALIDTPWIRRMSTAFAKGGITGARKPIGAGGTVAIFHRYLALC
jgi:hypothetical protein